MRRRSGGFGAVSRSRRRQADLFFADLMGWEHPPSSVPAVSFDRHRPGGGLETLEELFGEQAEAFGEQDESACPPPGRIPSSCTGIRVPEVLPCFGFEGHEVLPRHQPKLINLARCILASQSTSTPITTLRIVGHTDASGTDSVNDPLGMRRAQAVKSALESTLARMTGNRAPRLSITLESRGRRELLPGAAALSRRVEIFPPFAFPVPRPPPALCAGDFQVTPASLSLVGGESAVLRASENQSTAGRGPVTYTWTTASTRLTLVGASMSPQSVSGRTVTVQAGMSPTVLREVVEVTRTQPGCAPITKQVRIAIVCERFRLARPRIIATATDTYLRPTATFNDPALPSGYTLRFGQDLSFGTGRAQPHGVSVGTSTAVLERKMRHLLTAFASNDTHGKARRLFDAFLTPRRAVSFWSDADLTSAAEAHPHIATFISRSLSAPTSPERSAGQTRIHQALQNANWDISAAVAPAGLGVPAFNRGSKAFGTEDFGNGLGVMINGLQHVVVIAKEYFYNPCRREYYLKLEYVLYDVFGLDDDDLREFGADGGIDTAAAEGITAWWQLQHQHGYAPLITRISFEREFTVPAR